MRNRCVVIILTIAFLTGCVGTPPVGNSFHYTPQSSQPHWFSDSAVLVRTTPANFIQYLEEPFEKTEFIGRIRNENTNKKLKALSIKESRMADLENVLQGTDAAVSFPQVLDFLDLSDPAVKTTFAAVGLGFRDFFRNEYKAVVTGLDQRQADIEGYILNRLYSRPIAIFDIARAEKWCDQNYNEKTFCKNYKDSLSKVGAVIIDTEHDYISYPELVLSLSPVYYLAELQSWFADILGVGGKEAYLEEIAKNKLLSDNLVSFPKQFAIFEVQPGKNVRGTKYY